jgi:hypothetical protein
MRLILVLSALLAPLSVLAAPTTYSPEHAALLDRQARPTKPKPCVAIVPAPSVNETLARFNKFAQAFIYKKNITEAFEYISKDYIVRPTSSLTPNTHLIGTFTDALMCRITTQPPKMGSTPPGTSSLRSGDRKASRRSERHSKVRKAG